MGRPPVAPEERHRNRVTINLTDREYEELTQAAEDEAVGTLLRRIVLRYLARRRK